MCPLRWSWEHNSRPQEPEKDENTWEHWRKQKVTGMCSEKATTSCLLWFLLKKITTVTKNEYLWGRWTSHMTALYLCIEYLYYSCIEYHFFKSRTTRSRYQMGWVLPGEVHALYYPTIPTKVSVTSLELIAQPTGSQKEMSFPDILVFFQNEQKGIFNERYQVPKWDNYWL